MIPSLPPLRFDLKDRKDEASGEVRQKWTAEIGRLMVAFAAIESLTYVALKRLPHDPVAAPVKQFQLKERIDVLLAILGAKDDPFYNEFNVYAAYCIEALSAFGFRGQPD